MSDVEIYEETDEEEIAENVEAVKSPASVAVSVGGDGDGEKDDFDVYIEEDEDELAAFEKEEKERKKNASVEQQAEEAQKKEMMKALEKEALEQAKDRADKLLTGVESLSAYCLDKIGEVSEDGKTYVPDSECLRMIRNLVILLRDDPYPYPARDYFFKSKVLDQHLVPLLTHMCKKVTENEKNSKSADEEEEELFVYDQDLLKFTLKLVGNLTRSIEADLEKNAPDIMVDMKKKKSEIAHDKSNALNKRVVLNNKFQQYLEAKDNVGSVALFVALRTRLTVLVKKEKRSRRDEEEVRIILNLILNIVSMPDKKRDAFCISAHDNVMQALLTSKIHMVILFIGASIAFKEYTLTVLKILYSALQRFDPKTLAQTNESDREAAEWQEKNAQRNALKAATEAVREKKAKTRIATLNRFRGAVECVNFDLANPARGLITNRPYTDLHNSLNVTHTHDKPTGYKPKKKTPKGFDSPSTWIRFDTRTLLKDFCEQVIVKVFNHLMKLAKVQLVGGLSTNEDRRNYVWAIYYFLKFSIYNTKYPKHELEYISEVVHTNTFDYIANFIKESCELHNTGDGRPGRAATEHKMQIMELMRYGIMALETLLQLIKGMKSPLGDTAKEIAIAKQRISKLPAEKIQKIVNDVASVLDAAKTIQNHIFYVPEFRELMLLLLKTGNPAILPIDYIEIVVDLIYQFLHVMKDYLGKNKDFVTIKKRRKIRKRNTDGSEMGDEMEDDEEEDDLTEQIADSEGRLEFTEYIKKFAHYPYLQWYEIALSKWRDNPHKFNYKILKMLSWINVALDSMDCFFTYPMMVIARDILNDDASKEVFPGKGGSLWMFADSLIKLFFHGDVKVNVASMFMPLNAHEIVVRKEDDKRMAEEKVRRELREVEAVDSHQTKSDKLDDLSIGDTRNKTPDPNDDITNADVDLLINDFDDVQLSANDEPGDDNAQVDELINQVEGEKNQMDVDMLDNNDELNEEDALKMLEEE